METKVQERLREGHSCVFKKLIAAQKTLTSCMKAALHATLTQASSPQEVLEVVEYLT